MTQRRLGIIVAIVTVAIWAYAFPATRSALGSFSPEALSLLRLTLASACLLAISAVLRIPPPPLKDFPRIGLLGILGYFGYQTGFANGSVSLLSGTVAIIICSVPVTAALLAAIYYRERSSRMQSFGTAIAFSGVLLIVLAKDGTFSLSPGVFWVLLAVICIAHYLVLQRDLVRRLGVLRFTTWSMTLGTLPLLVYLPELATALPTAEPAHIFAVAIMAVFATAIGFMMWIWAIAAAGASTATLALFLQPVFAGLLAWLWLGEIPPPGTFVGGIIVIAGMWIAIARPRAVAPQVAAK